MIKNEQLIDDITTINYCSNPASGTQSQTLKILLPKMDLKLLVHESVWYSALINGV